MAKATKKPTSKDKISAKAKAAATAAAKRSLEGPPVAHEPGWTGEVGGPKLRPTSAHFKGTDARKTKVLEILAQGLSASKAAATVGVNRSTLFDWKKDDPEFAEQWAEALIAGGEYYEDEVQRRAVEGTLKPVFQQGDLVGHIREYSDNLLIMATKARFPEKYRERSEVKKPGDDGDFEFVLKIGRRDGPAGPPSIKQIEDGHVSSALVVPEAGNGDLRAGGPERDEGTVQLGGGVYKNR